MKKIALAIITLFSVAAHAQLIKDEAREDGCHEYWFTLDEFSKPVQLPIRVEQLDGSSVKLTGETALQGKTGLFIVEDVKTGKIDSIVIPSDGKFSYVCNKLINFTLEIEGYVTYDKTNQKLDGLSMLVVKLHPNPDDVIYLLITKTSITETALKNYMRCLFESKKTGSDKSCTLPEFVKLETR